MLAEETKTWYENYYKDKGKYRNDLLHNPEVLFQTLAYEMSIINAVRSLHINPISTRVLDIGCGNGGSLLNFLRLGFNPSQLCGIDILEDRILDAKNILPGITWICGDASHMEFENNSFDIVFSPTMFVQITDDTLAEKIANEMLRVTKTKGNILLADWRYSWPNDKKHKALSKSRLSELFRVGSMTGINGVYKGMLIPPIGRLLSKRASFLYFPILATFPFLAGQLVTVLQKNTDG